MENRAKKRKAKKRIKKKYILRRIILIFVILVLGILFFFGIEKALRVEEVRISGIERMSRKPIDKILDPLKGENYILIDKRQISSNLEKLPYIKEASLSYQFPSGLGVQIKEEDPVAQIFTKKAYLLVNKELKVVEETRTFDDRLPKITGIQASEVRVGDTLLDTVQNKNKLDFFQALFSSKFIQEVSSIDIMEQGIQLFTKSDIKVIIRSYQDASYKINQLEKVYKEVNKSKEEFSTILLDQSDHPVAIKKTAKDENIPMGNTRKEELENDKRQNEEKNPPESEIEVE